MAGAASSHVPVKVVYIDTQYVETDPLSFKLVVQSLAHWYELYCCVDGREQLLTMSQEKKMRRRRWQ
ncbi:hypothetical protein RHGRI_036756 [Rhododendron griersonianum]|uniref:VQ domain-containing protein n=1 Tax=Rhododendron griersonianum TaxID=479676 RepID=A0AAV6HPA2_9ERIC|nr:hypothetical protein RHGRI_036756 [Rhododendron griersonianum]